MYSWFIGKDSVNCVLLVGGLCVSQGSSNVLSCHLSVCCVVGVPAFDDPGCSYGQGFRSWFIFGEIGSVELFFEELQ